jgi:uncharacterized protein (TIGR00266 family)
MVNSQCLIRLKRSQFVKWNIKGNPDFGQLEVELESGETFVSEAGSMAYMSSGMNLKSKLIGGLWSAVIRKFVGGESLFAGEYSHPVGGNVTFSPNRPGSVMNRTLTNETFILTAGSYMASSPGIKLKTRFGGFRAIFSGEGAFVVEASGSGELFFNSYGAIIEKRVSGEFTVDTGHAVAWEQGLDYQVQTIGGLKSTLFSGEGLVLKFTGEGIVYTQTRTMGGLSHWLTPFSGR